MRPDDKTVTKLIDKYTYRKELYVLEVATLFGSLIEYNKRGYSELISINSFPCELVLHLGLHMRPVAVTTFLIQYICLVSPLV